MGGRSAIIMRVQGWEKILNNYITETAYKEFEWGVCDCLIFVSDASNLICGKDPMSYAVSGDPDTIRGQYKTDVDAYVLIKKYRKTLPNIMDVHFNRVSPAFAQRGDIVGAKLDHITFGICWGGKAYFKTDTNGYTTKPLKECQYAWRVE